MEVICDQCRAKFKVPDDKLPEGRRVAIRCPKCQNRITLNTSQPVQEASETSEVKVENEYTEGIYETGPLALVMENDAQALDLLKESVESLGYRYVRSDNTRDAIRKLRLRHFDLIILTDRFEEIDMTQSLVLQHLNNLPMAVRRQIFLALIRDDLETMDQMAAFVMSANLVINRKDLDKLTSILERGMEDHRKFYQVYVENLAEVGEG